MNLQENIQRIREMMGLLTEQETSKLSGTTTNDLSGTTTNELSKTTNDSSTTKVIDVVGYDLSKVIIPKMTQITYPTIFYYKKEVYPNGPITERKSLAILNNGFVYYNVMSDVGDEIIIKIEQKIFEDAILNDKLFSNINNLSSFTEQNNPTQFNKLKMEFNKQKAIATQKDKINLSEVPKIEMISTMQGKSYIFDIWATWCGGCLNKMNNIINPLNDELSSSGLTFFFYSIDTDVKKLKSYVNSKVNYGIHVFDDKGFKSEVFTSYPPQSIPKTFFIDKNQNLYVLPETLEEAKNLILGKL